MILKILLYVVLFLGLFALCWGCITFIREFKRRRYLNNFVGDINSKFEERRKRREAKLLYQGATKDKSFIDKADNLIEKSGIRIIFPKLTSEILILFTILFSLMAAYVTYIVSDFLLISLAVFACTIFIVVLTLKYMARHTFNLIDDQILVYLNILINLCDSNDDIVTIFDKSTAYIKSPLKEYTEQFVFECKRGVPLDKAFDNFKDKIESKNFKRLLKNLSICAKHDANFKIILNKSKTIMKFYFIEKERRRRAVTDGRITILATIALGAWLFMLSTSISSNLLNNLKNTFNGNVLVGYLLAVLIIAIYKFISLDKFNI